jgi:hypothetical protein
MKMVTMKVQKYSNMI